MASTFNERWDNMFALIIDDDVTTREAYSHFFNWIRFEIAFKRLQRMGNKCEKIQKRLDDSLSVIELRKELNHF
jgi:hypothetical protein